MRTVDECLNKASDDRKTGNIVATGPAAMSQADDLRAQAREYRRQATAITDPHNSAAMTALASELEERAIVLDGKRADGRDG